MTTTIITAIVSVLFLWLIYDLIKGIHNAKKSPEYSVLKYGDTVRWWEDRVKPVEGVVLGQIKGQVRIRRNDDYRVLLVRRDECELTDEDNENRVFVTIP